MRLFETKWFVRYARRERLDEQSLREAIVRTERGLVDADLGGGIIKQRVARTGEGRSGGFRLLIAYRSGNRAVFLYGFAKSEQDNIGADDLETLREIGAAWLEAKKERLEHAIKEGLLKEVSYEDKKR
ncbi:MAG: type II toxin-antitoxin system RelE/ParE family toxin [Nitrospirae bacterium]|nr:type II toxin-antitoxin system RelE/ParE family toxin [Nitrospirota bacterium]